VNFEQYEESINSAKESLADGDISDAHSKIDLISEIKDDLYEQIDAAVEENQNERVEQFTENRIDEIEKILDKGAELGLTQNTIDEFEKTLEVLKDGETSAIFEQTGEGSVFEKEMGEDIVKQFEDDGVDISGVGGPSSPRR